MQIVVLTNESLKEELLSTGVEPGTELTWIADVTEFLNYPNPAACIDLLFENKQERLQILNQITAPVIINSVEHSLQQTNPSFVRINGWNTFLRSNLVEAAAAEPAKQKAEAVMAKFNKTVEWLQDLPGFVTPRVISMIINEAFIAWKEGVSTKEEIDTAMKLGTNYPYGPFEWAEKIGVEKLASLLEKLGLQQTRYSPSIA